MKKLTKKNVISRFRFAWQLIATYNFSLEESFNFSHELSSLELFFIQYPFKTYCSRFNSRLEVLIFKLNSRIDELCKSC